MEKYVGSKIFDNIKVDERVNSELKHCLYCYVNSNHKDGGITQTEYKIPLEAIGKGYMWQCPACKLIYILKDEL